MVHEAKGNDGHTVGANYMTKRMIDSLSAIETATEKMTFGSLFPRHPSHSSSPETQELPHHIPLSNYMSHTKV